MTNSSTVSPDLIEVDRIPAAGIQQLARAALAAVREAFEDPAVRAASEAWRKARRLAGKV